MKQKIIIIFAVILSFYSLVYADTYKFQPGDYINLFVYNAPELCGEFRIYADGFTRLPLVGKVHIAGMSEDEAYNSLRLAISKFMKDPNITLAAKYSVSVMGYVAKPGVFIITDSDRIIAVIALAGGFTPEASGSITIYREGKKIDISKGKFLEKDSAFELAKPGDIIFAKRKFFTRGDFSWILSTFSVVSVAIYYYGHK
ncbi:MAG: polysaccharide biosynthesis/export family protein [Candidatus Latescibacter sp.]|nr:polysaccharide biosynthesis/export family protein [Candidatus Latescibacter sp.]